jgi:hypothetical protein
LSVQLSIPTLKKLEKDAQTNPNLQTERAQREQAQKVKRDQKTREESKRKEQMNSEFNQKRNEFLIFAASQLQITSFESLLTEFQKSIAAQFEQKISEWIGKKQWKLLYKASQHDFAASTFHQRCDNEGPTLIIIEANEYLFGGYTPNS